MAMNGIRDLSIIATPPARRVSIKTFVRQKDDLIIREAILREILRGGQVYYLHNDVASIENTAEKLTALVPEARVVIGHGQMRERELERVMSDFYHQRYNVLVCSTIIETGIDVPTANTIIIERADNFGLAQLHQLRGRVGRSHHQAYAYLLTPPPKLMTKDAKRRLEALESLDNLGAGFILATHDLEIRGAGELLGNEQSGQIESIGFSLYMELLDAAVKALKEGREPSLEEITHQQAEIELRVPALLPDDYLGDVNMRLSFYKRIAAAESKQELDELKVEIERKNKEKMKDELGDVLFSIVNIARFLDIDATEALEGTIKKFDKRFRYVEQNCDIEKTSLENLEKLWQNAKKAIARHGSVSRHRCCLVLTR